MIWNDAEKQSRSDMDQLQLERLRITIKRAYDQVAILSGTTGSGWSEA